MPPGASEWRVDADLPPGLARAAGSPWHPGSPRGIASLPPRLGQVRIEGGLERLLNDEHALVEAGEGRVVDRVVQQSLAAGADGF